MAECTMRRRSSSRCSIRLMPGSSARSDTAFRALPIASVVSTMLSYRLLRRHGQVALSGCNRRGLASAILAALGDPFIGGCARQHADGILIRARAVFQL